MPRSLGFIRGKSGFHPRIFLDIATYPDPKYWPGFLDVADAKLIAYATANQSVIVTNELAKIGCKKPKIPSVSAAVGVKCLSLLELFQETQPKFVLQNDAAI